MSISSMTGYGFGKQKTDAFLYSCEVKSLNSRFLEVNVRLPRGYHSLEASIIRRLKEGLSRGKVDTYIELEPVSAASSLPVLDESVAKHYFAEWQKAQKIAADAGIKIASEFPLSIAELVRVDGMFGGANRNKDVDVAELHTDGILAAVDAALIQLKSSRADEGANLQAALTTLGTDLGDFNEKVRAALPEVRAILSENFKKKLELAIEKINTSEKKLGLPPEERMMQELGILLDKQDIDEEITRLHSHVLRFHETLELSGSIGRKLDFLCQEMHREVNTMSNKAVQTPIAEYSLAMKQIVEQIRQQVQNVE